MTNYNGSEFIKTTNRMDENAPQNNKLSKNEKAEILFLTSCQESAILIKYPRLRIVAGVIQEEVFLMAKVNETYETMAVYSLKNGEEGVKALNEKFTALIEANGTMESVNEWGKRKLAYEINYEAEGYYVLYTFTSKPDFPAELDRVFKITDGVMRSMTTVK